ncbi:hypothetical protein TYRP_000557 [Tyrophagus putrescentiae]|nr:hypothetical protein TYRP_000557 [Tyrophagus putrescentiae]
MSTPVKVSTSSGTRGVVQLLAGDGRTVQGLFIDQAQFPADYFGQLLRRVRRSIALTLVEFEAAKIVDISRLLSDVRISSPEHIVRRHQAASGGDGQALQPAMSY